MLSKYRFVSLVKWKIQYGPVSYCSKILVISLLFCQGHNKPDEAIALFVCLIDLCRATLCHKKLTLLMNPFLNHNYFGYFWVSAKETSGAPFAETFCGRNHRPKLNLAVLRTTSLTSQT